MEVVNVKWVTHGGSDYPSYVELTFANGQVKRYY